MGCWALDCGMSGSQRRNGICSTCCFNPGAFSGASLNDLVSSEELNPIIQALRQETGVTEDAAREIFSTLFVFVHGYASLLANNEMKLEEDQLALSLKKVLFGAKYAEKEIENEGNI